VATYRRRRETKTCVRNLQLREGKAVGVRNFRKAVLFALDGSVFSIFSGLLSVVTIQVRLAVKQYRGLGSSWNGARVSREVLAAFLELQPTSSANSVVATVVCYQWRRNATGVTIVCGVGPSLIREVRGSNLSTTETPVLILYVRRRLCSRDAMVAG